MLRFDVRYEQVSVAQNFCVVNVDGLVVGPAPGDERARASRGHALQQSATAGRYGEILRTGDDARPLGNSGRWSYGTAKHLG